MRDALAQARLGVDVRRLHEINRLIFSDPELWALTGCVLDGSRHVSSATATPAALAMLLIGALADVPPSRDWNSRIMRAWRAWPHEVGHDPMVSGMVTCPLTGQRTFGRALSGVLARPSLARLALRLELCRTGPLWSLWYRNPEGGVARAVYVGGIVGHELAEALTDLPGSAFIGLPGKTLHDLAALMAPADAKRKTRQSNPSGAAVSPAPGGIAPVDAGPAGGANRKASGL
jgi:hypothetical protein